MNACVRRMLLGMRLGRKGGARTHRLVWLLAGLHHYLRLHRASWTVTLVCCKQRCE